jgi:hypothetical protein
MTHIKFNKTLNSIYQGIDTYTEMRNSMRVEKLLSIVEEDKDFRYIIPMFLLPGFDVNYFENATIMTDDMRAVCHKLYLQTRRVVLAIKASLKNRVENAAHHRTAKPIVDLSWFNNDAKNIEDVLVKPIYDYKMKSEFFYENEPKFNTYGPLYLSVKDKLNRVKNHKGWSSLAIEDRKFSNNSAVIEYYIYSGQFPIEGKLVKNDINKSRMYLKPSVDALREAIRSKNPQLLGLNLSQYERLAKTVKCSFSGYILENYSEIKKYTKRCDLPYLVAWRTGNYEFTLKESLRA